MRKQKYGLVPTPASTTSDPWVIIPRTSASRRDFDEIRTSRHTKNLPLFFRSFFVIYSEIAYPIRSATPSFNSLGYLPRISYALKILELIFISHISV